MAIDQCFVNLTPHLFKKKCLFTDVLGVVLSVRTWGRHQSEGISITVKITPRMIKDS
jgi:hypothetical protein